MSALVGGEETFKSLQERSLASIPGARRPVAPPRPPRWCEPVPPRSRQCGATRAFGACPPAIFARDDRSSGTDRPNAGLPPTGRRLGPPIPTRGPPPPFADPRGPLAAHRSFARLPGEEGRRTGREGAGRPAGSPRTRPRRASPWGSPSGEPPPVAPLPVRRGPPAVLQPQLQAPEPHRGEEPPQLRGRGRRPHGDESVRSARQGPRRQRPRRHGRGHVQGDHQRRLPEPLLRRGRPHPPQGTWPGPPPPPAPAPRAPPAPATPAGPRPRRPATPAARDPAGRRGT